MNKQHVAVHRALYALKKAILDKIRNQTIPRLMADHAAHRPDEIALYHSSDDTYRSFEPMSWSDLHHKSCALASFFISMGIDQKTILIMSRNRPEHFITDLAIQYSKNIPASIYTSLKEMQIAEIIDMTQTPCIIVDDEVMYGYVKQALNLSRNKPLIITISSIKKLPKQVKKWSDALNDGYKALDQHAQAIQNIIKQSKPSDVVCTIFTSGTTGKPKGALLSHENVLFAAAGIQAVGTEHIPRAKLVSYLPLAHVFERVVGYYGWIYSRHIIYCVWNVNDLKDVLPKVRPHIFVGVPRVYEKIEQGLCSKLSQSPLNFLFTRSMRNAKNRNHYRQNNIPIPWMVTLKHKVYKTVLLSTIRRKIGLDQCKLCLSGSAPLSPEVIDFFAGLDLDIVEGYGLTENSAPATVSWNSDIVRNMSQLFRQHKIDFPFSFVCQYGRVGLPMPGTKVKIDDQGCVSIYGPHVFKGYLHDQRNTQAALDGKWLKSGDLGQIHSTGELEIIGRKKDLIILSNGKNIAPRHIEDALSRHPLIAHVCLFGDNMAYLTAVICLCCDGGELRYAKSHRIACTDRDSLAKNKKVLALLEEHVNKVNQKFCRPLQVKYFHLTSDQWSPQTGELTPTLKLKRPVIQERYAPYIEYIYQQHDPSDHASES